MADEDAALKEMLKHLEEAARHIQASRHLMQENELVEDPNYLGLLARVSEALDMTEAARREARRRREQAERERDELRRELYALREPQESPETAAEASEGGEPRLATGASQEPTEALGGRGSGTARGSWWRRVVGR